MQLLGENNSSDEAGHTQYFRDSRHLHKSEAWVTYLPPPFVVKSEGF